jgi:hypothetical protein
MTEEVSLKKMEEEHLKELLWRRRRPGSRRGWRCPDEILLAAYVDRSLDAVARRSLEAHLADCDSCLGQVSFLMHTAGWKDSAEVPPQLLARAERLVSAKRSRSLFPDWRWTAIAGAAACLLITFALVLALRQYRSETPKSGEGQAISQPKPAQESAPLSQTTTAMKNPDVVASSGPPQSGRATLPSPPAVRKGEPDSGAPKLIFPREGSVVKREHLEFRWQPVPNADFYEVSIVSASGDPVVVRQTDQTRLALPSDGQLISGTKYFVSIRAHLHEGKTARSSVVSFRVSP